MKKLFSKIASVSLAVVMSASVLTVAPITASAETFTSGDYEYEIINTNEARLTGYTGKSTNLTLPTAIGGFPVTQIGYKAFFGNQTITSITIPKTIVTCATDCFSNTQIKTAVIENGATVVADNLFQGCSTLENVTIPNTVTVIENDAFRGCASLKSVKLPENLTSIQYKAFNSTGLTEITIPKTVVDGNMECFANTKIKTAVIENGATVVADNLFYGCSTLESVSIPNTVTSIESDAFRGCTSLKSVKLPNSLTTLGYKAFNSTGLTEITIPKTVVDGNMECFANTKIKTAVIENGATVVANSLFYDCTTLESVSIPNTVTSIESDAFRGCTSLKSVKLPSKLTTLGYKAFNSTGLTEITIPKTVVDGNMECFANTKIKTAVIENGATVVADSLFYGCTTLESVSVPNTVTSIEGDAFRNCKSLKSVELPAGLTSIGYKAFDGTALTEITIPKKVNSINLYAVGYSGGKVEGFVIKGYAGTEAQKYAEENGFTFIALSEPKPVGIIGDVNQDGILDVADATYLQMHLAGYKNSDGTAFIDTYNSNMFMIADVNGDAVLDVADVTQIQMILAGLVK